MATFEFSIVASGLDPAAENFESRFYDAGCDDALVSFQKGHIIVDFSREAATLADALASAVACVRRAGAEVERVEPDPLVSLSDIASRTGMSRAAMTNYAKGLRGRDFPPPSVKVTSDSPLWDWATVAWWLVDQRRLERPIAVEAEIVKDANKAIGEGVQDLAARLAGRTRALAVGPAK